MSIIIPTSQDSSPDTRSDSDRPKSISIPSKPDATDTADASSADGRDQPESTGQALVTSSNLPASILSELSVFLGGDGNAYIRISDGNNTYVLRIGSKQADHFLLRLAHQAGMRLKRNDIRDINDELTAHAELYGDSCDVWYRVAPFQNGIELDTGDDRHTRIRVTPCNVETITKGSDTLFHRTPIMQALPMPAQVGDLGLLKKYLNVSDASVVLLIAWISYTLAHPKLSTTNFVILVLQGDQGSGKTFLCKIIQSVIDPGAVGVQTFPSNQKDLIVSARHAHVLLYDNLRSFTQLMADTLCIAATGGTLSTRQLYTDADLHVHRLHVALMLNGIHPFVDQPDLAQRCLPLNLLPIDDKDRRSESVLDREFQADLPKIFRGLLDLIANVLKELPSVEPTNPERMFDISHWLAAMEKVDGAPTGVYQAQYSDALKEGMLDSLMENPLAAAVMSFITDSSKDQWSGSPTELLQELNCVVGRRSQYSRDWPQTASALSKRLKPLQAGLRRQGIEIKFGRGKHRNITITNLEAF